MEQVHIEEFVVNPEYKWRKFKFYNLLIKANNTISEIKLGKFFKHDRNYGVMFLTKTTVMNCLPTYNLSVILSVSLSVHLKGLPTKLFHYLYSLNKRTTILQFRDCST